MKTFLLRALCVLLCVLPGCAGILTGADEVPVVAPLPAGWAYQYHLVIEYVDAAGEAATGEAKSALPDNSVAGAVTIFAFLKNVPIIGALIYGMDSAKEIAKDTGAGGSSEQPVTPDVLKAGITDERVTKVEWMMTPVKAEEVVKAPAVAKE